MVMAQRSISCLPFDEFLGELRRMDSGPVLLDNRELMELMLRADFALYDNYQYSEEDPLPVPIDVFADRCNPDVKVGPGWLERAYDSGIPSSGDCFRTCERRRAAAVRCDRGSLRAGERDLTEPVCGQSCGDQR